MKSPKQVDFKFGQTGPDEIKYLALEGGGGKGNAYLGAIQVLEKLKKLPLSPEMKKANSGSLLGIAGASAGAITAYLLALGCSSEDIQTEMTFDFNKFFEPPLPGVYKCIVNKGAKNEFLVATDSIQRQPKPQNTSSFDSLTGRKIRLKGMIVKVVTAGNTFSSVSDAQSKGRINHLRYKNMFQYHRNPIISMVVKSLVSSAISNFFRGAIRIAKTGFIRSKILDKVIKETDNEQLKQYRNFKKEIEAAEPFEISLKDRLSSTGGETAEILLFKYLIKLPIWTFYGKFIKDSTKRKFIALDRIKFILTSPGNKHLDKYLDCLKFDKAFYSGIEVRNFFTNATILYLIRNFNIYVSDDYDTIINPYIDIVNIESGNSEYTEQETSNNSIRKKYKWISENTANKIEGQGTLKPGQKEYAISEIVNLTFSQFYAITENDIRVVTSNISKGIPCTFSKDITPDFPIIDAVCMSMSIPVAFKPTFVDTTVTIKGVKNEDYHGFHSDGGMLNNLPLHLFDDVATSMTNNASLNKNILAIRLSDGFPRDKYTNTKEDNNMKSNYLQDPLYKKFLIKYFNDENDPWYKKQLHNIEEGLGDVKEALQKILNPNNYMKTTRHSEGVKTNYYNGSIGMTIEYLGETLSTGLYYQSEVGQFRTPDEPKQALELFCYPVGIFNFGPDKEMPKEIFSFIQARALMKTAVWLCVNFEDIEGELKKYYNGEFIDDPDWKENLKPSLEKFYNDCQKG